MNDSDSFFAELTDRLKDTICQRHSIVPNTWQAFQTGNSCYYYYYKEELI